MVLISANVTSGDADIEIWTEVANQRGGPSTQGQTASVLGRTKSARLRNGVVSGDALVIDFHTLMGRPPQSYETNLELCPSWIRNICG